MVTLNEFTIIRAPIERGFDLARSVEVHLAGNVHWGEAAVAEGSRASVVDFFRTLSHDLLRERNAVLRDIAESGEWQRLLLA